MPLDGLGLKHAGGVWGCPIFGDGLCIANAGGNEIVGLSRPDFARCDNSAVKVLGRLNNAIPVCGIHGEGLCVDRASANGDTSDTNGANPGTPHLGLAEPGQGVSCVINQAEVWVTNRSNNSVSSFHNFDNWWPLNPNGGAIHVFHQLTPLKGAPAQGGGLADPRGVGCDHSGKVWIANHARNANSVTQLEEYFDGRTTNVLRVLSPDSGFSAPGMNRPYGVAVDQMGDVWISNEGNDTLTVFIGAGR